MTPSPLGDTFFLLQGAFLWRTSLGEKVRDIRGTLFVSIRRGIIWRLTLFSHLKENLNVVSIIYSCHIISGHNMKLILTIWTLDFVDCVPFSWYFSQSSQLILKNLILKLPKNMIKPLLLIWKRIWLYRLIFELRYVWWNQMLACPS